jgi:hypothetical protein
LSIHFVFDVINHECHRIVLKDLLPNEVFHARARCRVRWQFKGALSMP